ncbi:HDIG domain-containing protein [Candidatus Woesearchaeota archaeon]|nr:HDIG domain-containing protein [Candidatus Woesearchaeota archaeon]
MDEKQAIELLKKYAPDEETFNKVFAHSKAVQRLAMRIAEDIVCNGHHVDIKFVITASLLHDIGRFKIGISSKDKLKHGLLGAEILRKEGLDEKYALVCERHIGSGITVEDIEEQGLDLLKKDYLPETVEEKIICYADSLIFIDKEGTIQQVVDRYRKEVGERLAQRTIKLHNEIEKLRGRNHFF